MEQEQSDLNDSYKQSLRNRAERNPTLTKNMPNVKWDQLPPRKGPDSVRPKRDRGFLPC